MTTAGLPEGWSLRRLDQIARVTSGKRLPKGRSVTPLATPHPYLRVTDMRMGKVDLSNIHYVPEDVAAKISRYTIDSGELYISCAGTLGIVGMVPEVLHGANLTENANRISGIQVNPHFLLHVLMSEMVQGHIQNIQTVGAQPKLALGRIRNFQIPCPDDPKEQEAIAEALSDADALIEGLERLIAKKRLIKQGAMQDLLTAKRRLPGFSAEWTTSALGSLSRMRSGGTPSRARSEYYGGQHPWVSISDMTACGKTLSSTRESLSDTGLQHSAAVLFPEGTVLFAMYASVGAVCIATSRVSTSQAILGIETGGRLNAQFLYYWLLWRREEIAQMGQHGTQSNLNKALVQAIEVSLPMLTEQIEIVAVLSDIDAEIQALETRLEKARQVKEGMMQNLLTGRIRLI